MTASRWDSCCTHRNCPVVAMTCSTRSLSAGDTPGQANKAVMPWPTNAGVLGMVRTTRSVPSHLQMLSVRMPAATERCSAARVWLATGAAASLKTCGLTAQTTSWAALSAAPASEITVTPVSCRSRVAVSAKGSTTVMCAGGMP